MCVVKTKALICAFVFAYAKSGFLMTQLILYEMEFISDWMIPHFRVACL